MLLSESDGSLFPENFNILSKILMRPVLLTRKIYNVRYSGIAVKIIKVEKNYDLPTNVKLWAEVRSGSGSALNNKSDPDPDPQHRLQVELTFK
jgi:hypothetical protein